MRTYSIEELAASWGAVLPPPGTAGTRAGRPKISAAGDEILGWLDKWGMVLGQSGNGESWDVECPWLGEHSDRANTGSAYWPGGGYKCHHGHCEGTRGRRELAAWVDARLQEESGGLVRLSQYDFPKVSASPADQAAVTRLAGVRAPGDVVPGPKGSVAEDFFGELVFLAPEDRFYSLRTGELLTRGAVDMAWTSLLGGAGALPVTNKRGDVLAPSRWWAEAENAGRARVADRLTYAPGEGRYFREGQVWLVNRWIAPDRLGLPVGDADVEPWLRLAGLVTSRDGTAACDWLLDWFALVVACPGVKPGWHVVLQGPQGLGKDMLLQPVIGAVGRENVGRVNAGALHGPFNAWAERRLVIVNELRQTTRGAATGSDQYNALKEWTENTNDHIKINGKYQREYYARNVAGFVVTSNDVRALAIEADDRRFMVVMAGTAQDTRVWPKAEYAALARWLAAGGSDLVGEWLWQRWERMGSGRRAGLMGRAPVTTGREELVRNTEDPVTAWMRDQIEDGIWPDLMTSKDVSRELAGAAKAGGAGFAHAPSPNKWGAVLVGLGGAKLYGGGPVRLLSGERVRVWATRGVARFAAMGEPQIARAYKSAGSRAFRTESDGADVIRFTDPKDKGGGSATEYTDLFGDW